MSDSNNSGSSCRNSLTERLVCIDRALERLSDTSASSIRSLLATCQDGDDSSASTTNLFARHRTTITSIPPTLQEITDAYAPRTLEKKFQELYRTLHPALIVAGAGAAGSEHHRRCNASAFVQGPRGSGKTLLLNRVLMALADEIMSHHRQQQERQQMFRLVYVNGILIPGHSVQTVVREILQQLADAALQDNPHHQNDSNNNNNRAEQFLRLKRTSFTNQLQLLTEILELASVDGVPVLFVLDELDTFVTTGASLGKRKHRSASISNNNNNNNNNNNSNSGANQQHQHSTNSVSTSNSTSLRSSNHQLLLYHLLERVATQGSFCSLVGLTTDSAILTRLEKRIQSRAEGTAQFVVTGPCRDFHQDLVPILLEAIADETTGNSSNNNSNPEPKEATRQCLRQQVAQILLGSTTNSTSMDSKEEKDLAQSVHEAFELEHRLGRDVRWFRRVVYFALALYRHDVLQWQQQNSPSTEDSNVPLPPHLTPRYFEEALVSMGGAIQRKSNAGPTNTNNNNTSDSTNKNTIIDPDLRLQALRDLSGPQVALVLAARRILHRDTGKTNTSSGNNNNPSYSECAELPQLTLHRMLLEYQAFYKGNSRYSTRLLRHAFVDLLETGLLRPAADHSGVGPFQYHWRDPRGDTNNSNNVDAMDRMPLHLTVDIHREIKRALDDNNVFHCSTALREWGKHTN